MITNKTGTDRPTQKSHKVPAETTALVHRYGQIGISAVAAAVALPGRGQESGLCAGLHATRCSTGRATPPPDLRAASFIRIEHISMWGQTVPPNFIVLQRRRRSGHE